MLIENHYTKKSNKFTEFDLSFGPIRFSFCSNLKLKGVVSIILISSLKEKDICELNFLWNNVNVCTCIKF